MRPTQPWVQDDETEKANWAIVLEVQVVGYAGNSTQEVESHEVATVILIDWMLKYYRFSQMNLNEDEKLISYVNLV